MLCSMLRFYMNDNFLSVYTRMLEAQAGIKSTSSLISRDARRFLQRHPVNDGCDYEVIYLGNLFLRKL